LIFFDLAGNQLEIYLFDAFPGDTFLVRAGIFKRTILNVSDLIAAWRTAWAIKDLLENTSIEMKESLNSTPLRIRSDLPLLAERKTFVSIHSFILLHFALLFR